MAALSLCGRTLFRAAAKERFLRISVRCQSDEKLPDPIEHATGLEKREILAELAGNDDPYNMKVRKRGAGTKDQPNLVPSAFESRIIGCICEEEATSVSWMWLHKDTPRRCGCGYWFKLVKKAPL